MLETNLKDHSPLPDIKSIHQRTKSEWMTRDQVYPWDIANLVKKHNRRGKVKKSNSVIILSRFAGELLPSNNTQKLRDFKITGTQKEIKVNKKLSKVSSVDDTESKQSISESSDGHDLKQTDQPIDKKPSKDSGKKFQQKPTLVFDTKYAQAI